ncbi:MAG: MFS transporter [Chloroflexota bacterium]
MAHNAGAPAPQKPSFWALLSPKTLPVFLMFFFWGFGTGGLWLVRPLFAYDLGDSFLLVALVSSVSAAPRVITGPLTGWLTDRFGRKPFIILGAVLHIIALTSDFFVHHYLAFFLLEILAGTGISVWMTSASALLADSTVVETRGRAVALRESSSRIGLLTGPVVGGLIATFIGLRWVFLFIAATKLAVVIVTVLLIRESAKRSPRRARSGAPWWRADMSMFRTRAFFALAVGTVGLGLVVGGTGVFRTLFPVQTRQVAGLDAAAVGNLIAVAGLLALIASMPAGLATDRYGRKKLLLASLSLTAVSVWLMAGTTSFASAAIAVIVFGTAEAMGTGTIQVYAMDQAPDHMRGAFLGVWHLFTNIGQITGPLLIGGIADWLGFTTAFWIVALVLVAATAIVAIFGVETGRRGGRVPAPGSPVPAGTAPDAILSPPAGEPAKPPSEDRDAPR